MGEILFASYMKRASPDVGVYFGGQRVYIWIITTLCAFLENCQAARIGRTGYSKWGTSADLWRWFQVSFPDCKGWLSWMYFFLISLDLVMKNTGLIWFNNHQVDVWPIKQSNTKFNVWMFFKLTFLRTISVVECLRLPFS